MFRKKQTSFECPICGKAYPEKQQATECESYGKGKKYPKGMIFQKNGQTMAVNQCKPVDAVNDVFTGHYIVVDCWKTNSKDKSKDKLIDIIWPIRITSKDKVHDPKRKDFLRMLEHLKKQKITPLIWNGKEAVEYTEN